VDRGRMRRVRLRRLDAARLDVPDVLRRLAARYARAPIRHAGEALGVADPRRLPFQAVPQQNGFPQAGGFARLRLRGSGMAVPEVVVRWRMLLTTSPVTASLRRG